MAGVKDVIIYMHGITPMQEPQIHTGDYNRFEALLKTELSRRGKSYPGHRIDLEWGFTAPGLTTGDRMLAGTERMLLQNIEAVMGRYLDPTLFPLRLVHHAIRKSFVLGVTDMFYYVSEDGKADIRQNIFGTILNCLPPLGAGESYAFTIVAHSAGAAIMHDLLFIIFGGSSKSYLTGTDIDKLHNLQEYARSGQVFIKAFITLGAPITPLIVRSRKMLEKIYGEGRLDGKLDLESIGIRVDATGRRSCWLNFWDKDDVIGFPIAFLYDDPDGLLEDHYLDIGDVFPLVHVAYWGSQRVAQIVSERY
jgi:hypothetical protein